MRMNRPLSPHLVSKSLGGCPAQDKTRSGQGPYSKSLLIDAVVRVVRKMFLPHPNKEATYLRCVTFHSIKEAHYHNNWLCHAGSDVRALHIRQGTGGKALCENCDRLNAEAN
jgi:hypothetical protein